MIHDFVPFSQVKACQMCSNAYFKNVIFFILHQLFFLKCVLYTSMGNDVFRNPQGTECLDCTFLDPGPKHDIESLDCTFRDNFRSQQNAPSATDFTREWPL